MQQHQVQQEQQQQPARYHLRSQSANQASYANQKPRQVHGIEAELDMQGVEEFVELEEELKQFRQKIKN
jgi:hypothetical protein